MRQVFEFRECPGTIHRASDVFRQLNKININHGQENLIVIYLDARNKMIDNEVLFKGGLDAALCDQRVLFKRALEVGAHSIIIAHNHPSGSLKPSKDDKHIYKKLKQGGKLLNIGVLDSVIFNEEEFYSCEESG